MVEYYTTTTTTYSKNTIATIENYTQQFNRQYNLYVVVVVAVEVVVEVVCSQTNQLALTLNSSKSS